MHDNGFESISQVGAPESYVEPLGSSKKKLSRTLVPSHVIKVIKAKNIKF